jgi:hypothetical protein
MTENTATTVNEADAVEIKSDVTPETKAPKAKDFTSYAAKAPTSLHSHYADWLQAKTGIDFSNVPEQELVKIVQLSVVLYHDYQASDENKARKAAEAAGKTAKAPSKVKQELAAKDAEIEALKAQLAAASATPANGPASATATGEASSKPVGRRTAAKK